MRKYPDVVNSIDDIEVAFELSPKGVRFVKDCREVDLTFSQIFSLL